MKNSRYGFTLAEILVTITIVGFASALVLNVMMHKKPNQNKAMFRKAYYIIEREASAMAMDDDNFPTEIEGSKRLAYYDASLCKDEDCKTPVYDSDNVITRIRANTGKYFCKTFASALNTVGPVHCYDKSSEGKYSENAHSFESKVPSFVTNDGINWFITPNIICDPTSPEEKKKDKCKLDNINNVKIGNVDPVCPTKETDVKPFICVYFDVNGIGYNEATGTGRDFFPDKMVSGSEDAKDDVEYADRGYVYVYWNGKVKAPVGQTSRYLKSVTVL